LDRKNNELEDMQSEHQLKVAQLESLNQRLERKLTQLERESAHLQELRDKEASESRQAAKLLRQQLHITMCAFVIMCGIDNAPTGSGVC
jgi:hypothetical protein